MYPESDGRPRKRREFGIRRRGVGLGGRRALTPPLLTQRCVACIWLRKGCPDAKRGSRCAVHTRYGPEHARAALRPRAGSLFARPLWKLRPGTRAEPGSCRRGGLARTVGRSRRRSAECRTPPHQELVRFRRNRDTRQTGRLGVTRTPPPPTPRRTNRHPRRPRRRRRSRRHHSSLSPMPRRNRPHPFRRSRHRG